MIFVYIFLIRGGAPALPLSTRLLVVAVVILRWLMRFEVFRGERERLICTPEPKYSTIDLCKLDWNFFYVCCHIRRESLCQAAYGKGRASKEKGSA